MKGRITVNEKRAVRKLAIKHRDRIFSDGLEDISLSSIDFSVSLMKDLAYIGTKATGLVGWLKISNSKDRVFIMYVKVRLRNKETYYIDIFSGEEVLYRNKMKSLKNTKGHKNKK